MGLDLRRRSFLVQGGALAAATALPAGLTSGSARAASDWGPLVSDPDGILDLPAGFTYRILQTSGQEMSDGYVAPQLPDGMAAFAGPSGTVVLMRNHENTLSGGAYGFGQAPPEAYDASAMGAVTRLVLDGSDYSLLSSNLVLTGTIRNCAGGMSPWGWLSCEETTQSNHGYVFLCATDVSEVAEPVRIDAYGRFSHEAACVDPSTDICYLTEDEGDSCLYRMVPTDSSDPFTGPLQALKVVGEDEFSTSDMSIGDVVDVEWVDIDDPQAGSSSCRSQGQSQGAAIFVRGEGIWFHEGAVYICSTSGGPVSGGQIFRLVDDASGSTLELLAQSTDRDTLDMPDNITVAPNGEIFMAEDGSGTQYVRVLTLAGEVVDFARNAESNGEICGVCFSPDGQALFLNVQGTGRTFVITGPFDDGDGGDSGDSGDSGDEGDSGDDSGNDDDSGSDDDSGNDDDSGSDGDDSSGSDDSDSDGTGEDNGGDTGTGTGTGDEGSDSGSTDTDGGDTETGDASDGSDASDDGASGDSSDGTGSDAGGDGGAGDNGGEMDGGGAGCRISRGSDTSPLVGLVGAGLWTALTARRKAASNDSHSTDDTVTDAADQD